MGLLRTAQHRAACDDLTQLGDVADEQVRLFPTEPGMLRLPPRHQVLRREAAEYPRSYLLRQQEVDVLWVVDDACAWNRFPISLVTRRASALP